MFGMDHNEAGRLLLERLGMPKSVLVVAAAHHDPPVEEGTQMIHLVRGACKLATAMGFGLHDDPRLHPTDQVPDETTLERLLAGLPHAYRIEIARHYESIQESAMELVAAYDQALV